MAPPGTEDSDSDHLSDSEAPQPLSDPSTDHELSHTFDSLTDLMEVLEDFGRIAGFGVYKMRSANYRHGFGPTRVDLGCLRGKIRPSKAHSRNTSTTKMGCKWQAVAKALLVDGVRRWTFELKAGSERHTEHEAESRPPFKPFSAQHKAFITQYLDRPAISNREIAVDLRRIFPGIIFTRKQLRNCRHRLKKASLSSRTPFQALKKFLDDEAIHHQTK